MANIKHGWCADKELRKKYRVWYNMKRRCDPACKDAKSEIYREKGIKVCDRWQDLQTFWADMGDRPPGALLDRIDKNGDYEPSNCRWATKPMQIRSSNVVKINEKIARWILIDRHNGLLLREIAGKYGMHISTVSNVVTGRRWKDVYAKVLHELNIGRITKNKF